MGYLARARRAVRPRPLASGAIRFIRVIAVLTGPGTIIEEIIFINVIAAVVRCVSTGRIGPTVGTGAFTVDIFVAKVASVTVVVEVAAAEVAVSNRRGCVGMACV
jgi:hypothetical protein